MTLANAHVDTEVSSTDDILKWIKALEITIEKYRAQELVRIPRHCIEKYYLQDIKCQCALELLRDMQEPDFMDCLKAAIEHLNSETPSEIKG